MSFPIKRGVRQGCVLSPKIFNQYTEKIFRKSEDIRGIVVGGRNINNLRFADDTLLIAEGEEELQILVDMVKEDSLEDRLKMNVKKTKTMVIRRDSSDGSKVNITVDGRALEQVESYVYLGQLITEDGRSDKEIRRRIKKARRESLKSILTSRKLTMETRKRLIMCCPRSYMHQRRGILIRRTGKELRRLRC